MEEVDIAPQLGRKIPLRPAVAALSARCKTGIPAGCQQFSVLVPRCSEIYDRATMGRTFWLTPHNMGSGRQDKPKSQEACHCATR
jgi:hypothetical protein